MKLKIATGETVNITKDSRVLLVEAYDEKYPGFLEVDEVFESYVAVKTKQRGEKPVIQFFSPEYIAEVSGGKEILKEDLRPLVRDLLENMLPNLVEQAVKDAIKDKLTDQFFQQVAATTVKATVKTEVVAALRAGATAINK